MKTFEITFTHNNSGIYSANLCKAETAEQAKAYFQTLGNYEIVGISETNSDPEPWQSVYTVPENWERSEENARTAEEITADIIAYFESNEEIFISCVEELDNYNGYLNDDRYYNMDDFNEFHNDLQPDELLRRAFYGYDEETYTTDSNGNKTYGAFNTNRNYFRHNGYGNLVSADYKDYSANLDEWAVKAMSENRYYIDSIEDSEELAALFDELEAVEE